MNQRLCLTFLLFFTISIKIWAQSSFEFYEPDLELKRAYATTLKYNFRSHRVPPRHQYSKELNAMSKERHQAAQYRLEYNHLVIHPSFDRYVSGLKSRIAEANPEFDFTEMQITFMRYPSANAFSTGDGTIAVHLGMMPILENEDQLAFVVCHEMAHTLLSHSEERYIRILNERNSDAYKEALKRIYKSEYYQATQLKEFLKSKMYSDGRFSRKEELQADSLAVVLFLNAGYQFEEIIKFAQNMNLLQYPDSTKSDLNIFEKFNLPQVEYNFDKLDIASNDDPDVLEDDSVSDHPSWLERIDYINSIQFKNAPTSAEQSDFEQFKQEGETQHFFSLKYFGYYARAFVWCINPSSDFVDIANKNSATIDILKALLNARKEHNLGHFLGKPNESQTTVMNDLSNLMYGSRYKDLAEAFYQYANQLYEASLKDKTTDYNMIQLAKLANKKEEAEALSDIFVTAYPLSPETRLIYQERRMKR